MQILIFIFHFYLLVLVRWLFSGQLEGFSEGQRVVAIWDSVKGLISVGNAVTLESSVGFVTVQAAVRQYLFIVNLFTCMFF